VIFLGADSGPSAARPFLLRAADQFDSGCPTSLRSPTYLQAWDARLEQWVIEHAGVR
jgi:hypothetical protein